MPYWSREQEEAIKSRDSNLLVSAAAGSGKTAVLVERIIRMITEEGINIDVLLVVTFTNAAAGEMRERISSAIAKEMEKETGNKDHLRRQMTLLSKANITTIHAFCIDIVRKHLHIKDIDPSFRIGDVTETAILKIEAIEELFESEYEKENELFFGLIERFGGNKEDTPLSDLVLKIYDFIQSQPRPYDWLREKTECFNVDTDGYENILWVQAVKKIVNIHLEGALDLLKEGKEICKKTGGPEAYLPAIEEDIRQAENLKHTFRKSLTEFYKSMQEINHQKLSPAKKDVDSVLKDAAKGLREQAKGIIKGIRQDILETSPEEYAEDLQSLYPLMTYLYELVVSFGKAYGTKKAERGILDFNDLEHFALDILENPMVAREYSERFQYIFVDEYQDSNIVQETLIQRIKRENNVFMVGDVKQSIYRFRLADPTLFIDKYEKFDFEEGALNRRIDLSKNFRSRGEIISGVNFIFQHIMSKSLGEIDYNKEAYLYQGREFMPIKESVIELYVIEKECETEEESESELEEMEDIEVEARITAMRIKELLSEEIFDEKQERYRKIDYKDIAVLMRATLNWAHIFSEIFTREGIPAYADVSTGYFEAVEISIFMNLLKAIDNKRQDLPLLSVMRSPMAGFSAEELIEVRIHSKEGSYFEAVEKYIEEKEDSLKEKLDHFINKLNKWADEARTLRTDEFIWKLLKETGYYYYVGAMPGGIQRQANLRILLERAELFEKTAIKGLFNFIKFVEKLKSSKGDMGAAKILGENDNVVRIMSVHKSKGLEFPVVITAGMGKNFNLRDTNADVLLHKDLGIGPKYVDIDLRVYRDTIAKIAMKNIIKIESLSEEMRILYVAMTRAKDRLILIGSVRNLPKQVHKWSKNISPYALSSARSFMDWIGTVVVKHPDGECLRQAADIILEQEKILEDASKWKIKIRSTRDIIIKEHEGKIRQEEYKILLNQFERKKFTDYKEQIDFRLGWKYPYGGAVNIPSKISVSDIKKPTAENIESINYKTPAIIRMPRFMEGAKAFSPAEKGTILHFVLQHIDLAAVKKGDNLEEQLELMISKELITCPEAEVVNLKKIEAFYESPIGKRLLRSDKVCREVPFNLRKKAAEVIEGLENCDENLLVQGIIDCYFTEEEEIVLIDYKSDFVPRGDVLSVVKKYNPQLSLYKEALEKITGKKVKESYLYLFDIDQEVKL